MHSICLGWKTALTKLSNSNCWSLQPQEEKGDISSPEQFPFLITTARRGQEASSRWWTFSYTWQLITESEPLRNKSSPFNFSFLALPHPNLEKPSNSDDQKEEANPKRNLLLGEFSLSCSLEGRVSSTQGRRKTKHPKANAAHRPCLSPSPQAISYSWLFSI